MSHIYGILQKSTGKPLSSNVYNKEGGFEFIGDKNNDTSPWSGDVALAKSQCELLCDVAGGECFSVFILHIVNDGLNESPEKNFINLSDRRHAVIPHHANVVKDRNKPNPNWIH